MAPVNAERIVGRRRAVVVGSGVYPRIVIERCLYHPQVVRSVIRIAHTTRRCVRAHEHDLVLDDSSRTQQSHGVGIPHVQHTAVEHTLAPCAVVEVVVLGGVVRAGGLRLRRLDGYERILARTMLRLAGDDIAIAEGGERMAHYRRVVRQIVYRPPRKAKTLRHGHFDVLVLGIAQVAMPEHVQLVDPGPLGGYLVKDRVCARRAAAVVRTAADEHVPRRLRPVRPDLHHPIMLDPVPVVVLHIDVVLHYLEPARSGYLRRHQRGHIRRGTVVHEVVLRPVLGLHELYAEVRPARVLPVRVAPRTFARIPRHEHAHGSAVKLLVEPGGDKLHLHAERLVQERLHVRTLDFVRRKRLRVCLCSAVEAVRARRIREGEARRHRLHHRDLVEQHALYRNRVDSASRCAERHFGVGLVVAALGGGECAEAHRREAGVVARHAPDVLPEQR